MDSIILNYKQTGNKKTYDIIREERSQFQKLNNENFIYAKSELELLEEDQSGQCFKITIPSYKQSNKNGMYKWVENLQPIRRNVVIKTGEFGEMNKVENLPFLRNKWNQLKYDIISKHKNEEHCKNFIKGIDNLFEDGDRFMKTLKFSFPYNNFFPDIFNKELIFGQCINGYTELPNFLGVKNIPIITKAKYCGFDVEKKIHKIDVEGEIDSENFDQETVTSLIKTLKNSLRIPTKVKINYIEKYFFDENHWPVQILNMVLIQIPGTLYREEKTILKAA